MRRKGLIILVAVFAAVVLFSLRGCKSGPEKSLLSAYFHAISLKDTSTMATMAIDPQSIEAQSWQIITVSLEETTPYDLPDLNKKELELKKKLEDHVGPVMEAEDGKYTAEEELKTARTGGARAAAKKKMEEAAAKYDQEREVHRQLQKDYNDAKAAAQREQDIALFSLSEREMPTIRDMTGTIHSKTVDVKTVDKSGVAKSYRFYLEQYLLKDEASGYTRNGAWKIVKLEPIA
jgi:hypothetical protein